MIDQVTISGAAIDELQRLRLCVETRPAAIRVWERLLSPDQQKELTGFEEAFRSTGPIGPWMALRKVSAERAVVELAVQLNFADRETARWLLRELGEEDLTADPPSAARQPSWNKETRQLLFGGKVARRVMRPRAAKNVVSVLDAFQEQGWPPRIDDPLPGGRDPQRLHRTVEILNEKLDLLRFRADGTGEGIAWEVV